MSIWYGFFGSMVRQVRACGWTCTLLVRDYGFRPIGIGTVVCASLIHDNDNHG